ncbi:MAG: hypothetical protein M1571_02350 [Firmicutes bacterium]|nr:hypothetical protein [Bacillota bacterium]
MEKVYLFTQTDSEIFENVFKTGDLLMNHVVIPVGKVFPKHQADADVYALIVRGVLSVAIEDREPKHYGAGRVLYMPKGTLAELGNRSNELVELFVVKQHLD